MFNPIDMYIELITIYITLVSLIMMLYEKHNDQIDGKNYIKSYVFYLNTRELIFC